MFRHTLLLLLLAASFGGPYLLTETQMSQLVPWLKEKLATNTQTVSRPTVDPVQQVFAAVEHAAQQAGARANELLADSSDPIAGLLTDPLAPPLTGPDVFDLAELFRFDLTKDWVSQRWPRITTRLSESNLEGYRVPLVTGPHAGSLAGSLTYYFDHQDRLARIIFLGRSADPSPLVALTTSRYGFQRRPTDTPGNTIYQLRRPRADQADSELRIDTAPTLDAEKPFDNYTIALWLQRPSED